VHRVAAGEHGRPRELGVGHLVVDEAAFLPELVSGEDARTEEPPFVAAEDHVGAGDGADDGGCGPVADVGAHREGLGCDEAADRAAGGCLFLIVNGVGVLHALDPAADVRERHRLLELAAAQDLPEVAVNV
jgi:hypothetical protein